MHEISLLRSGPCCDSAWLGESARIRGEKERELNSIESEAYRKAQEVMGRADAEATGIYAAAYGTDPEFYRLLRTLESLSETADKDTTLVLTTGGEYYQLLQGVEGRR